MASIDRASAITESGRASQDMFLYEPSLIKYIFNLLGGLGGHGIRFKFMGDKPGSCFKFDKNKIKHDDLMEKTLQYCLGTKYGKPHSTFSSDPAQVLNDPGAPELFSTVNANDPQTRRISADRGIQRENLSSIEKIDTIVEITDAELIEDKSLTIMAPISQP